MRDALLQEREKILKELESVENVLVTRYGWAPDSPDKSQRESPQPVEVAAHVKPGPKFYGGGEVVSATPIKYSEEFRDWLAGQRGTFTVNDFRDDLYEMYGEERVNDNSLRTPFRTAENSGDILVVSQGSGRKATIYASKDYRPPPPPPPAIFQGAESNG